MSNYKYLLYIAKLYSIPVFRPIVAYLEETGRDFAFYVSDKVALRFPSLWDRRRILTDLTQAKQFHPDFVFCPGNFVDFRIPGIKTQIFHGLGIEKSAHYDINHFFDIYCTSGPVVTSRFNQMAQKHGYFLVEETGWPKVDYILQFREKYQGIVFEPPAGKKVILYAPTFSSRHQSASRILRYIREVIRDDEFWIFKFHDLMADDLVKPFYAIPPELGVVVKNEDITPFLYAADVLISDTSSVVYEFMLLDKPVITYRTESRPDKGIDIRNIEELRPAIERCLNQPGEFRAERQRHMSEVNPYTDGLTTQRLVSRLEDLQKKGKFSGRKKPLNLFRKGQVLYHGRFRQGYLK